MEQIRVGSRNRDMDTTAALRYSSVCAIAGQLAEEAYNHYPFKPSHLTSIGRPFILGYMYEQQKFKEIILICISKLYYQF